MSQTCFLPILKLYFNITVFPSILCILSFAFKNIVWRRGLQESPDCERISWLKKRLKTFTLEVSLNASLLPERATAAWTISLFMWCHRSEFGGGKGRVELKCQTELRNKAASGAAPGEEGIRIRMELLVWLLENLVSTLCDGGRQLPSVLA